MLENVTLTASNSNASEHIRAVLDTGADLTVVSPEWVQRHNVELDAWNGPTLYMANGSEAEVMGLVEIDVSNDRGKAAGTAIVMKLNGHDLLLGNNFIRQFGKLEIIYSDESHHVTLGEELPIEMIETQPEENRLHVTKGRRIPKRSMARIAVKTIHSRMPINKKGFHWMLSPSKNLLVKKGLSTSNCILKDDTPRSVYITNLSNRDVYLPKSTCVGKWEIAQVSFEFEEKGSQEHANTSKKETFTLTKEDFKKQINPELTEEQLSKTLDILMNRIRVFAQNDLDLGRCKYTTF